MVLLIAGVICLLAGTLAFYARDRIFDANHFANSAVKTLDNSDVRDVASTRITDDLIAQEPDLVAAKPLLQAGTGALIQSSPFKTVFRQAVLSAHEAVFSGKDDAVVTLANIGVLLQQAIAAYDQKLAKKIPKGTDSTLVKISEGGLATDTTQAADNVRFLGLVLPPLGLLLLIGSALAALDTRRAVIRAGAGVAIGALLLVVALTVAKGVIGAGIEAGADRDAFDAIWEIFLGPLGNWFLVLGGFGIIVGAAASSALRAWDLGTPIERAWNRLATPPESTWGKILWAVVIAAVGLLMIFSPLFVIKALVVVGGAYLVSIAVSTVITLVSEPATKAQAKSERRRILAWALGGLAAAMALGAIGVGILAGSDEAESAAPTLDTGCNGSSELCDRSLDQVSFAATHNSYAGANYPGFLFPEQDNTIPEQLDAGIRGLWIDTYYGIPGRRVYTDTSKLSPALISQIDDSLGPKFSAAGQRLRTQAARPPASAKPKIYLCHGFCELGAVDAGKTFEQIASFMKDNPNEVLIIDLEDYTTPEDTQALIESTGLGDYIYKGPQGPPWPTLQEMIDSGGRILLVAEHMSGGASWYRPLNSTIQETPFDFKTPAEMTCKGGRGERSTTLFLINNWISTDPTPKPTNAQKVNAYDFLLNRARKCERQRQRFPNVLNVDFYKQGDVFGVVRELNGLASRS